jgi:hypothetical protein
MREEQLIETTINIIMAKMAIIEIGTLCINL